MTAFKPLRFKEGGHKKYKKPSYLSMAIGGSHDTLSPLFGLYEPLSSY